MDAHRRIALIIIVVTQDVGGASCICDWGIKTLSTVLLFTTGAESGSICLLNPPPLVYDNVVSTPIQKVTVVPQR